VSSLSNVKSLTKLPSLAKQSKLGIVSRSGDSHSLYDSFILSARECFVSISRSNIVGESYLYYISSDQDCIILLRKVIQLYLVKDNIVRDKEPLPKDNEIK